MSPIIPVILSGGSGSRLWPLSRETYPKQFLPLLGERSLLQSTLERVQDLPGAAAPMLVCNQDHRFLAAEQLRSLAVAPQALILEPVGRNTAPAVAVAALQAGRDGADPLLLILPADHVIQDVAGFHHAVSAMTPLAEDGHLLTFGITPDRPETGYGYIQKGEALTGGAYRVNRFVEKPDQATAERYLASQEYYWNSGMFLFRASRYLEELERFVPQMLAACRQALDGAARDLDFTRLEAEAFAACPGDSIDYAVMEKTAEAAVVPLDAGWSDVGSWSALWEVSERDGTGNVLKGDVIAIDSHNCY
ncbi:MAG: mannose-1-phosphate guanylyltransferase/mannose-6-phosphate isomerase, partial [Candidatus Competibacterales bacterium]|nr:mannose-1-phosphate guanylyltransferase/mannose-6-phosphate isomerase [Candidatus Competibacterales bacterium]